MAYDAQLDVQSAEKLHFKIQPAVTQQKSGGEVTAKVATTIRAGAADDSSVIGTAPRGASYTAIGTFGPYTKIKLGANRVGFVASSTLATGGSGNGTYVPAWNSTPPVISFTAKGLETSADSYKLNATITDETQVEDAYVFVSNPS